MADGYVIWYSTVSHPHILPLLLGDLPRPANEEKIIAQQWERYEARGLPDTYDMVSAVVAYADEQIGQEEVMSPQQWFQALSHVREQIAPILTGGEARGQGGGNNSISWTNIRSRNSRTLCFCLLLVFSYCGIYWLVSCKLS